MNTLDIIILIVFAASILYGLRRGVIAQLGSVGGVIVGVIACRTLGDSAATLVGNLLGSDSASACYVDSVIANVVLFITGYLVTRLIAKMLRGVAHALCLGIFDRIGGALFSLFAWFLAFSIALNLWQALTPGTDITAESKLSNGRAARAIIDLAPKVLGGETATQLFSSGGC